MTHPDPGPEQAPEARNGADHPAQTPGDAGETRPPARPRPQYGELAPEGWSWSPEGEDRPAPEPPPSSAAPGPVPAHPAPQPSTGRLPGVPHNLGVDGGQLSPPVQPQVSASQAPSSQMPASQDPAPQDPTPQDPASQQPSTPEHPQPYRSAPPQQHLRAGYPATQQHSSRGASGPQVAQANRTGDRIVTIALLALGAFGALYFAASLQQLPNSLAMLGAAFGIEGFVVPDSVKTLGNTGAIVVLALYAVTVIFAIQRMRGRKLAFWVPLAAGAIAFVVTFAFASFGLSQAPELMSQLADPDATAKLLDYLGQQGT